MGSRFSLWIGAGAVFLLVAVATGLQSPPADDHLIAGIPAHKTVIRHGFYALRPNRHAKFPDWVAYVATDIEYDAGGPDVRGYQWAADPQIDSRSVLTEADFVGSGYEKVGLIDRQLYNNSALLAEASYFGHVVPMKSDLAQGPWRQLETITQLLMEDYTRIWVYSGPYFEREMTSMANATKPHRVPSGYWKVIAARRSGSFHINCFLFDQDDPATKQWWQCAATKAAVEAKCGFTLFPGAPPGMIIDMPLQTCRQCETKGPRPQSDQVADPGFEPCKYLLDCYFCQDAHGNWVKEEPPTPLITN